LYGWTLFTVIQTGTIAAVAVAFGKFLGVFFPSINQTNWIVHVGSGNIGLSTANLVGILVVVFLTFTNTRGVKTGAAVQNVFTTTKVLALLGVIAVGLIARNAIAHAANFGADSHSFWAGAHWGTPHLVEVGSFLGLGGGTAVVGVLTVVAVVQVGSLFSSDAWNNVTFTAGEVRSPKRNLPLSLAIGTGAVSLLYIACNFVYLNVLPMSGIAGAPQDRVATAVMQTAFGPVGAKIMAGAILISTFGCVNGMVLAGARVYYAMSRDGLFFKSVGKLHPRYHTPVAGLMVQALWTAVLCVSGSYSQLLDYIIFAVLVFYILTIVGLFVLRRKWPAAPRPYRALGYPVLPGLYIVMATWICIVLLRYKPQYTWPGLVLVLIGIPVYFLWSRKPSIQT
jgi:APA family basic amino acid/polyamine antiporter